MSLKYSTNNIEIFLSLDDMTLNLMRHSRKNEFPHNQIKTLIFQCHKHSVSNYEGKKIENGSKKEKLLHNIIIIMKQLTLLNHE